MNYIINKPKISYLIPTIKPTKCVQTIIQDIYNLPNHEYEIIIVSPNYYEGKNIKWIPDIKKDGSVHAFNVAYKYSNGEIIVTVVDDCSIPPNFLDIYDYFDTPDIKKQKIQIGNLGNFMGGPGKQLFFKKGISEYNKYPDGNAGFIYKLDAHVPLNVPNLRPYVSINFPCFKKESIENYLGGVIFNSSFLHGYCDLWLGFYSEIINGNDIVGYGPKNIYYTSIDQYNSIISPTKNPLYDQNVFICLISNSNIKNLPYNCHVIV